MVDEAKSMYEQWEGDLGGPGKVIEIDVVFVLKRKYNVGKRLVKEELVIFGITEREGGAVQILDDELYSYLVTKEEFKEQKVLQMKRQQQRQRCGAGVFSSDETERGDQPSQTTNGPSGLAEGMSGSGCFFHSTPTWRRENGNFSGPLSSRGLGVLSSSLFPIGEEKRSWTSSTSMSNEARCFFRMDGKATLSFQASSTTLRSKANDLSDTSFSTIDLSS